MAGTAAYHPYQPGSIYPAIPTKKPRPSSMLIMNSPRYVPPQHSPMTTSRHAHYTSYDQYSSDRLHPNHTRQQEFSRSSNSLFSRYQFQQHLAPINTNIDVHDLARRLGPTLSSVPPHPQRHYNDCTQDAYVATLRKQKATVWCERAQAEDPRIMSAQRRARALATIEVTGSSYVQDPNNHGSSSDSPASSLCGGTSGHGATQSMTLASTKPNKILGATGVGNGVHTVRKKAWVKDRSASSHGCGKKIIMDPGSLIVGAVPTRLSASEVMGDSSDEDAEIGTRRSRRAPRTSFNSTHRQSPREYERSRRSVEGLRHTNSTGSKSSTDSSAYSAPRSIAEEEEDPATTGNLSIRTENSSLRYSLSDMSGRNTSERRPADYFISRSPGVRRTSGSQSTTSSPCSAADGLGPLPGGLTIERVWKPASELRRCGSVDEREARTRTMSGVRLFVANPDAN
ncbi:hypothetical protein L211DRAFT_854534 [Terfezia boudieri ATCC MYA-4762]|uniref:Uncharacterized protein n=1 Tax=Terfezia boudieri ATCC MYA-4762 TaxID=1051890 RepID=A0A3N4L649_9PEZI|nr:hypothetical protein L211DRAFT_854534 [Terfezia boudieri ATCC MYA-4762]